MQIDDPFDKDRPTTYPVIKCEACGRMVAVTPKLHLVIHKPNPDRRFKDTGNCILSDTRISVARSLVIAMLMMTPPDPWGRPGRWHQVSP